MKKFIFMLTTIAMLATACESTEQLASPTDVKLILELNGEVFTKRMATVTLKDKSSNIEYQSITDASGSALFNVVPGLYEATVSFKAVDDGNTFLYNGINNNITVAAAGANTFVVSIKESIASPIIIKELFFGGSPKKDNSGNYQNAGYVILYNNSSKTVDASDICFAFSGGNAHANNGGLKDLLVDGKMVFEDEGWLPAFHGVWAFNTTVMIPPYSQIVVSIYAAINHVETHPSSVDLSKSSYYAMYHKESGYNNGSKYAVAESIPTSNYLSATKYGLGNAWVLSVTSPAFFIFNKADIHTYASNIDNRDLRGTFEAAKIPFEWVIDGVDILTRGQENKFKRLTANVDAGSILFTNAQGYTVYRNVDKEATEAIVGNLEKLVYGYEGGTKDIEVEEGTTDPSGIDAEASIKNGAKIIYKDTNNSTYDFHERVTASLK